MGCDSLSSDETMRMVYKNQKISIVGNHNSEVMIGYTSSWRMGQLLHYSLELPERVVGQDDDMRWLVNDFVDAVRELFVEKGFGLKDPDTTQELGGTWLLAYKNRLYYVYDDFHIGEPLEEYAAVGSGASYALGALNALVSSGHAEHMAPEDVVLAALEAAQYHGVGIEKPFSVFKEGNPIPIKRVT